MTAFLEQLGDELDAAAARIVAGGAPRRRAPLRVLAPAVIAAAAVVLVLVLAGGSERPAAPAPRPATQRGATPTVGSILPFAPVPRTVTLVPGGGRVAVTPAPPALRGVRLVVLNGTTITGLATAFAQHLRAAGWRAHLPVGNYFEQTLSESLVGYGTLDQRAAAVALARALGIGRVVQDPNIMRLSGDRVTVVLGADAA